MFKIDSNQTIKMSKGDDVKFPVFLNQGTSLTPLRYPIYENMGCELYFSIYYRNDFDNPILKKTFKDNGEIVTEKSNGYKSVKTGVDNINDNNDFIVRFEPDDTNDLNEDSYVYQIKALIIDKDVEPVENEEGQFTYTYIINTVTNMLPIYIIDDNYGRRIW